MPVEFYQMGQVMEAKYDICDQSGKSSCGYGFFEGTVLKVNPEKNKLYVRFTYGNYPPEWVDCCICRPVFDVQGLLQKSSGLPDETLVDQQAHETLVLEIRESKAKHVDLLQEYHGCREKLRGLEQTNCDLAKQLQTLQATQDTAADVDQLVKEKEAMERERSSLRVSMATKEVEVDALSRTLAELKEQLRQKEVDYVTINNHITRVDGKVDQLSVVVQEKDAMITKLQGDLTDLTATNEKYKKHYGELLQSSTEAGVLNNRLKQHVSSLTQTNMGLSVQLGAVMERERQAVQGMERYKAYTENYRLALHNIGHKAKTVLLAQTVPRPQAELQSQATGTGTGNTNTVPVIASSVRPSQSANDSHAKDCTKAHQWQWGTVAAAPPNTEQFCLIVSHALKSMSSSIWRKTNARNIVSSPLFEMMVQQLSSVSGTEANMMVQMLYNLSRQIRETLEEPVELQMNVADSLSHYVSWLRQILQSPDGLNVPPIRVQ